MTGPARGFTLVEVLVALAILGVLALLGYQSLSTLVDAEARVTEVAMRWRALDALAARLETDLRAALPRTGRQGPAIEPAFSLEAGPAGSTLTWSRAGPEFFHEPTSAGQRLGYRRVPSGDSGSIELLLWPALDNPAATPVQSYVLAGEIRSFVLEAATARGEWSPRWPIAGEGPLPRALRLRMELAEGGWIERLFVLR